MRKILFTAIIALFSHIVFGQSYDINFEVIEKAGPFLGKEWDFSYSPWKPMIVSFDGKWLQVNYKESGKTFLLSQIDDVKYVEEYDRYDKSKLKSKSYILRTNEEGYYLYFVIKYEYTLWSIVKSLHIPYKGKDGIIYSYNIFQSDFIAK